MQREAQAETAEQLLGDAAQSETLNLVLVHEVPETPLLDKTKVAENETQASKGILSIGKLAYHISLVVYCSAKRFINHRAHGFSATVVEETLREFYMADFGAWVWPGMKETADKMGSSNQGLSGGQPQGRRDSLEV